MVRRSRSITHLITTAFSHHLNVKMVEIDRAVANFHQSLIVCNLPLVAELGMCALEPGDIYRGRPLSRKTDLLTVLWPCARDTGHLGRILA
jgi:hypothetical protein